MPSHLSWDPMRPRGDIDLQRADRVHVVQLRSLGDIAYATPCLQSLRCWTRSPGAARIRDTCES